MAFLRHLSIALITASTLWLAGCGGGSSSDLPSSGNSSVGAPSSILSLTLVETVSRSGFTPGTPGASINITQPGGTLTYSFIDANTILGEGVNVVPTLSWSYSASGKVATIRQVLQYGETTDVLTFNTPTSGTFRSDGRLVTGTTFYFEGTFTVSPYSGSGSGNSSGSGSGSGSSNGGSTTGQVAFWTRSASSGYISISVDGSSVGTLTSYYTSGTPTCGDSGTVTRTLSVGSHSMRATANNASWGPASFNVSAGGCLTYELQ